MPEDTLPQIAHSIIDNAICNGRLELLEGKLCFDMDDLQRLKNLLDRNLPVCDGGFYAVNE